MPDPARLFGWCKFRRAEARTPCRWNELPDLLARAGTGEFYWSIRWFDEPEARDGWLRDADRRRLPFRYWLWCDLDATEGASDADAFREGALFWRWVCRERYGLRAGRDFRILVSGRKGLKLAAGSLTEPGVDWDRAAKLWTEGLRAGTPFLDAAMPTQDVARAPGARHPEIEAWQNWVTPDALAGPPGPVRQAAGAPLRDDEVLDLFPNLARAPTPELAALFREIRQTWDDDADWEAAVREAEGQDPVRRATPADPPTDAKWEVRLRGAGVLRRAVPQDGAATLFRLATCPSCGRKDGGAYVVAGRLRCFRASCAAHGTGLPAAQWAPAAGVVPPGPSKRGRFGAVLPTHRADAQRGGVAATQAIAPAPATLPLLEARARLGEDVRRLLGSKAPGVLRVVRATPGLGKTTAVARTIASWAPGQRRTLIGCATHELAAEVARSVDRALGARLPVTRPVVHLHGRSSDNCLRSTEVAVLGGRGWDPGRYYCPKCPFRKRCGYYKDIESPRGGARAAEVVVTAYVQAFALTATGSAGNFDVFVLDEDPSGAILEDTVVGPDEVKVLLAGAEAGDAAWPAALVVGARLLDEAMTAGLGRRQEADERPAEFAGKKLARLLDRAAGKCAGFGLVGRGTRASDLLAEAALVVTRIEPQSGAFARPEDRTISEDEALRRSIERIRGLPDRNVLSAFDVLAREVRQAEAAGAGGDILGRAALRVERSGVVRLLVHRNRRPDRLPDVVLDAYADADAYAGAWRVPVELTTVEATLDGAAFLRVPAATSRTVLLPETPEAAAARTRERTEAWAALEDVVRLLADAGARKVLVVTQGSAVRDAVVREAERRTRAAAPGVLVDVRWFWSLRGLDAWRDFDGVVVFGEPEPPAEEVRAAVRRTFGGRGEPALRGGSSDAHARLSADPRARAVMAAMRESELAQVAHRIRPALPRPDAGAPRPVVVLLGRLDAPGLPKLHDLPPAAVSLAAAHVRVLRRHGATLLGLSLAIADAGGRQPGRGEATAALDAACAVLGAGRATFRDPGPPPGAGLAGAVAQRNGTPDAEILQLPAGLLRALAAGRRLAGAPRAEIVAAVRGEAGAG